ncbi:MAG: hypothetical protein GY822_05550 [Deltaproteobacteria bacterium]|nr:hypothetical protein [Deltaproteobacteria bacterium]
MKPPDSKSIRLQTNAFQPFFPREVSLRRTSSKIRVGGFVLVEENDLLFIRRVFQLHSDLVVVGVDTHECRFELSVDDKRLAGVVEPVSRRHRAISKWLWFQPALCSAMFLASLRRAGPESRPKNQGQSIHRVTTRMLVQDKHAGDVKSLLESSFGQVQT